jgi:hypothetical protein
MEAEAVAKEFRGDTLRDTLDNFMVRLHQVHEFKRSHK